MRPSSRTACTILGPTNLAASVPQQASLMFSKNLTEFLAVLIRDGAFAPDPDDPVVAATLVAEGGAIVHPKIARAARGGIAMSAEAILTGLTIFMLATFLGFEVIRRVPPLLHTPLMSLTNAISGISLVGVADPRGLGTWDVRDRARDDRRHGIDDQRRRRLPDHRPNAQDVPPPRAT